MFFGLAAWQILEMLSGPEAAAGGGQNVDHRGLWTHPRFQLLWSFDLDHLDSIIRTPTS